MIEGREIWACANQLLREHRGDARSVAALHADELLAEGATEGHRTFLRILRRIGELERMSPQGSVQ